MELNEFGLKVWKHKTNKRLFLQQSYRWQDNLTLLDETEGRQIVDSYKASTYDYRAWEPMTIEEYSLVKRKYNEIYKEKHKTIKTLKVMRLLEYINVSMYRLKEFCLYTVCGIEYYRNYERFYWGNIYKTKK